VLPGVTIDGAGKELGNQPVAGKLFVKHNDVSGKIVNVHRSKAVTKSLKLEDRYSTFQKESNKIL
jgi:hypothetical protein